MAKQNRMYGLLAEYETPAAIYKACEKVREAGYKHWDSYTPFPVHGLDKAMGLGQSKIPWFVFFGGIFGAVIGMGTQWYVSAVDYPILFAGKPTFPYQAFVPVTFEAGILCAAFSALAGMFALNGLPKWYNSLFNSPKFARVTDDRFFIAVEARDPKYGEETRALLESTEALSVEEVED